MGGADAQDEQLALLWVLNQSDGGPSLLDIAERSGLAFADDLAERPSDSSRAGCSRARRSSPV